MKISKIFLMTLIMAMACSGMTACMNMGGEDKNVLPTPEGTANFMPDTTNNISGDMGAAPGNYGNAGRTGETAGGALGVFDWANGAANIENNINQISEIAESRVVVTGTTALVGVRFTGAYRGEMTERIREMVAAEVKKADPGIQTVAVTADDEDVAKIYSLSDEVRAGRVMDELSAEINEIVRNATTLR